MTPGPRPVRDAADGADPDASARANDPGLAASDPQPIRPTSGAPQRPAWRPSSELSSAAEVTTPPSSTTSDVGDAALPHPATILPGIALLGPGRYALGAAAPLDASLASILWRVTPQSDSKTPSDAGSVASGSLSAALPSPDTHRSDLDRLERIDQSGPGSAGPPVHVLPPDGDSASESAGLLSVGSSPLEDAEWRHVLGSRLNSLLAEADELSSGGQSQSHTSMSSVFDLGPAGPLGGLAGGPPAAIGDTSCALPLDMHRQAKEEPYCGAPLPDNEGFRLGRLCQMAILDSAPERRFDRICHAVGRIFHYPMTLVTVIDSSRQWFKSVSGLPGVTETERGVSFCAWTLLPQIPQMLVVTDATADPRFAQNPVVTAPPSVRSYLGCPLVTSSGARFGSLCMVDTYRRAATKEDCRLMNNFTDLVVRELEAYQAEQKRKYDPPEIRRESEVARSACAWRNGVICLCIVGSSWCVVYANDRMGEMLDMLNVDELVGTDFWEHFEAKAGTVAAASHPEGEGDAAAVAPGDSASRHFARQLLSLTPFSIQAKAFTRQGQKRWMQCELTSGVRTQFDKDVTFIETPMDLPSEPSKHSYWFVCVTLCSGTSSPGFFCHQPCDAEPTDPAPPDPRPSGPLAPQARAAFQDIKLCERAAVGQASGTYHALNESDSGVCLVHVFASADAAGALATLRNRIRLWGKLMMQPYALLDGVEARMTNSAVAMLQPLELPCARSMRAAIQEGIFKQVPNDEEIAKGECGLNLALSLDCIAHLARGVSRLHEKQLVHGDITDVSVFVFPRTAFRTTRAQLRYGHDVRVFFHTFGRIAEASAKPTVQALAAVRPDFPLFFAPERFGSDGQLRAAPQAPADVWALAVLLAYMLIRAVPLIQDGPMALLSMCASGKLTARVLCLDSEGVPAELADIVRECLDPDPARRPSVDTLLRKLLTFKSQHLSTSGPTPT